MSGLTFAAAEQALAADRNQRASNRQLAASAVVAPAAEAQRSAAILSHKMTLKFEDRIGRPHSSKDER